MLDACVLYKSINKGFISKTHTSCDVRWFPLRGRVRMCTCAVRCVAANRLDRLMMALGLITVPPGLVVKHAAWSLVRRGACLESPDALLCVSRRAWCASHYITWGVLLTHVAAFHLHAGETCWVIVWCACIAKLISACNLHIECLIPCTSNDCNRLELNAAWYFTHPIATGVASGHAGHSSLYHPQMLHHVTHLWQSHHHHFNPKSMHLVLLKKQLCTHDDA